MAKKWSELRDKMSPEARARAETASKEMMLEIEALDQLRKALNLTQEQIAALIDTAQSNVSKLEKQQDMRISTLQRYVEALGGKLKIVAEVDGKEYMLAQFDN